MCTKFSVLCKLFTLGLRLCNNWWFCACIINYVFNLVYLPGWGRWWCSTVRVIESISATVLTYLKTLHCTTDKNYWFSDYSCGFLITLDIIDEFKRNPLDQRSATCVPWNILQILNLSKLFEVRRSLSQLEYLALILIKMFGSCTSKNCFSVPLLSKGYRPLHRTNNLCSSFLNRSNFIPLPPLVQQSG